MALIASKTARASMASMRAERFESYAVTPEPPLPLKPFVAATADSFQSVTASADARAGQRCTEAAASIEMHNDVLRMANLPRVERFDARLL